MRILSFHAKTRVIHAENFAVLDGHPAIPAQRHRAGLSHRRSGHGLFSMD
jgi:hypothetical protein